MANYINKYDSMAAYTAETSARDNLGLTVSLVTADGTIHYDGKLNPLGLPPFTIRAKFKSGPNPKEGDSQTLVDATENVWDITKNDVNWSMLFQANTNLISVLGANSKGVRNMSAMFRGCTSLTSVYLFDTSSVTDTNSMFTACTLLTSVASFDTSSVVNMNSMFNSCTSLTSVPLFNTSSVKYMNQTLRDCKSLLKVPLFDTSSVTDMSLMLSNCKSISRVPLLDTSSVVNMSAMFSGCTSVASGALALYQQASTQTNPPTSYGEAFVNCGSDTETGRAELSQIPSSWGGTMA